MPSLEAALTPDAFAGEVAVSRETLDRLQAYVELLRRWNPRINLVGPATLADVWRRHILDSAQLLRYIPASAQTLVDLGSGAGLPGLILAILGVPAVHLIEADGRKCAFLREAARVSGTAVTVHASRIAEVRPFAADVVTARALAPVVDLLDHAEPFLRRHSILLFLKGRGAAEELTRTAKAWKMSYMLHPSLSDPSGTILQMSEVARGG